MVTLTTMAAFLKKTCLFSSRRLFLDPQLMPISHLHLLCLLLRRLLPTSIRLQLVWERVSKPRRKPKQQLCRIKGHPVRNYFQFVNRTQCVFIIYNCIHILLSNLVYAIFLFNFIQIPQMKMRQTGKQNQISLNIPYLVLRQPKK